VWWLKFLSFSPTLRRYYQSVERLLWKNQNVTIQRCLKATNSVFQRNITYLESLVKYFCYRRKGWDKKRWWCLPRTVNRLLYFFQINSVRYPEIRWVLSSFIRVQYHLYATRLPTFIRALDHINKGSSWREVESRGRSLVDTQEAMARGHTTVASKWWERRCWRRASVNQVHPQVRITAWNIWCDRTQS